MYRCRLSIVLVAMTVAVASLSGQTPPSGQAPAPPSTPGNQPPVFRAGVEVLPLDVTVLDADGRQIVDLTMAEFTVEVDGKPRRLVSAEYIKLTDAFAAGTAPRGPAPALAAPPPAPDYGISTNGGGGPLGRAILLLIDQGNIRFGGGRSVMQNALKFVDRLQPTDRLGVVAIPGPGELVDFTTNHGKVREALLRVTGRVTPPQRRFNISITEAFAIYRRSDATLIVQVIARECAGAFGGADVERCERDVEQEASEIVGEQRMQTDRSVAAIRAVLTSLGALAGTEVGHPDLGGPGARRPRRRARRTGDHRGRRPRDARRDAARCGLLRCVAVAASDHGRRRSAAAAGRTLDAGGHGPRHAAPRRVDGRERVSQDRAVAGGLLPARRGAGHQRPRRQAPQDRGEVQPPGRDPAGAARLPVARRSARRLAGRGPGAHLAVVGAGHRAAAARLDLDLQGAWNIARAPRGGGRSGAGHRRSARLRHRSGHRDQGGQGGGRKRRCAPAHADRRRRDTGLVRRGHRGRTGDLSDAHRPGRQREARRKRRTRSAGLAVERRDTDPGRSARGAGATGRWRGGAAGRAAHPQRHAGGAWPRPTRLPWASRRS